MARSPAGSTCKSLLSVALLAALGDAGCRTRSTVTVEKEHWARRLVVREQVLCQPEDPETMVVPSPGSRHVAYWARTDGKWQVVVDGKRGPLLDDRTGDGWARSHNAWGGYVAVNGKYVHTGRYDPCIGNPVFSPDGSRVAYRALRDGNRILVVDGRVLEASVTKVTQRDHLLTLYQRTLDPVFSPDSRRIAWCRFDGKEMRLFVGRMMMSRTEYMEESCFSPNSRRLAYLAIHEGAAWLFINDRRVAESKYASCPTFSPNGRRLAFMRHEGTKKEPRQCVVVDGVVGRLHLGMVNLVTFSPDSKRFAYVANDGETTSAVIDGVADPGFPSSSQLIWFTNVGFSPDSRHYGYSLIDGDTMTVVVDGKRVESFETRGSFENQPVFLHEGRAAYVAIRRKQWHVIVGGKEHASVDEVNPGSLQTSADGRHLAYSGKHGTAWHAVVDTTEGPPFAEIRNLALSPDGRHVAYWARTDKQWHVVVNGLASPPFDHPLPESRLVFDSPDLLHGLGVRDLAVIRVEIQVVSGR